jgi:serine/threonine protein kinase
MSSKIGRFEILSEIAKSGPVSLYKASEGEGAQTIALKVLDLQSLGEKATALVQGLKQEADASKALKSGNIAELYSVEEIEGKFVAAYEYVQGNSIATMLARNEGFSIWDLQDIARQSCQALDHAQTRNVVHHSLEPAKIMVSWDGTVKLLGYGTSLMNVPAPQATGEAPWVLHYMSPEQAQGNPPDVRSNLFSLGAIFYEMMTEHQAFDGDDAEKVRRQIIDMAPVAPREINNKVPPGLSDLILKALAKDPEQRYRSGQELVADLEKSKERPAAAPAQKSAEPPRGFTTPVKPVASSATAAGSASQQSSGTAGATQETERKSVSAEASVKSPAGPGASNKPPENGEAVRRVAAAAGAGSAFSSVSQSRAPQSVSSEQFSRTPLKASVDASSHEKASLSVTVAPPEPLETKSPKISVDPLMAEPPKTAARRSFSEIDELPPLKEVYVAPTPEPAPAAAQDALPEQPVVTFRTPVPDKPKVQPREVAKKAVKEIKKTPPQYFAYSIAAAAIIMLLIVGGIAYHISSQSSDDDSGPGRRPTPAAAPAQPPVAASPAPVAPPPVVAAAVPAQTEPETVPQPEPQNVAPEPRHDISIRSKHERKKPARTRHMAAALVPGQLTLNSNPAGAQVSVDGEREPAWVTPYNLTGVQPGEHTVVISKAGYSPETRTIDVTSGSKSFVLVQLAALSAAVSVSSAPAGAEIFLDGKNTGRVTPALVSVDKPGSHTLVLRKQGYLDESETANVQLGQTLHMSQSLRALGVTDEIRYKKMFGGGKLPGMGTVSIKTQPKGAQIAINRRVLEKNSPVEFYLNPGTYVIDITLSGYKSIHRVVNIEKDGKLNIEEALENE